MMRDDERVWLRLVQKIVIGVKAKINALNTLLKRAYEQPAVIPLLLTRKWTNLV